LSAKIAVAGTPTAVRRSRSIRRPFGDHSIRFSCERFESYAANMANADLLALLALVILAVILALYLLRVDDNVGHLFILLGTGLCVIALLPFIFNTASDLGTILVILGLGCIAWGVTLRKKRFRWTKRRF